MGTKCGLFERLLRIPAYGAQYWDTGPHARTAHGHYIQDSLELDRLGRERASLVL